MISIVGGQGAWQGPRHPQWKSAEVLLQRGGHRDSIRPEQRLQEVQGGQEVCALREQGI